MIKFVNSPQEVITVSFFDLKNGEFFRHTNCLCLKVDESSYLELKIKNEPNGFPRFLGPFHCSILTLTFIVRANIAIEFV